MFGTVFAIVFGLLMLAVTVDTMAWLFTGKMPVSDIFKLRHRMALQHHKLQANDLAERARRITGPEDQELVLQRQDLERAWSEFEAGKERDILEPRRVRNEALGKVKESKIRSMTVAERAAFIATTIQCAPPAPDLETVRAYSGRWKQITTDVEQPYLDAEANRGTRLDNVMYHIHANEQRRAELTDSISGRTPASSAA